MKWITQFGIILAITFVGELLHAFLPLPVPASIYGLVLMLALLGTGILKLSQIRRASNFLLDVMPMLFVPAGVGLMASWADLAPICLPVILITIVTTVVVMAAAGLGTQLMLRREKGEGHE